ncbi:MAG TPA: amidohydrolase family protein [Verrucomicrobiota bacterium]|nr:amidohydrolase family protein [Verrucomicrobiota bacterium]
MALSDQRLRWSAAGLSVVAAWILWGGTATAQSAQPIADEERVVAIDAEAIYTQAAGSPVSGTVLIRGGKIVAIGEQLEVPAGAQRIRVHSLLPGLIDASSSAGISGGAAEQTSEVTPEINIAQTLDWRSRDFLEAVDEGVTTLHILPGTANVFAGGSCIVKSAGAVRDRVLSERFGSVVAVCADPTAGNSSRSRPDSIYVRQPTNRMGVVWIIRARLQQAQNVGDSAEADPRTDALRRLIAREEPMWAVSRMGHDIQSVLTLQREFGFQPVVVGGEEAYLVLDELAAEGVPVVFQGLTTGATRGLEGSTLHWNTPGKLEEHGIAFCLAGGRLLEQARFAQRFGTSADGVLAAITSRPAQLLRIDHRVGTIAPGKDADLVGLDGPPLESTTQILWTMVDGRVVSP